MSRISLSYSPFIHIANESSLEISHTGIISTLMSPSKNTYFVSNLSFNLLSVGQLCDRDLNLKFSKYSHLIQDLQTGK